MAEVTVNAEPIEITTDDGIVVRVGGTVTITGEVSGTPTGGAGGALSGTYPNPGLNTEALQDAVGAMTGAGLVYDDSAGDLLVRGELEWTTAPSDGTETTITVDANGRLSAQVVEVLDGAGGGEEGRATIVLPDPAEVVGQMLTIVVPTGVPGPTLHAPVYAPGIFGDLADYTVELEFASTPTTYRWTVVTPSGTDTYDAVLDEDYASTTALGAALFGPLLASGDVVLDVDGRTVWQTEADGDATELFAALVTVGRGADNEITVETISGPDALGLEGLESWPGEYRVINGVDGWAKGHDHTHLNRDAGGPHAGVVIANEQEWRWVVYPHDRVDLIGLVTPDAAGGFFSDLILSNVGQAVDYIHAKIADPALASDGDVLTWDATAEQWQAAAPTGGGGTVEVVSNVAADRILGRVTAGSGNSEELTASEVRTLLNVADGATAVTLSSSTPAALGTAAAGTATSASRADHVHQLPAVAVAGQDEGATITATSATTLLDAPFSISLPNNGDSMMLLAWGTTLNNSGSSRSHVWTVEWGNLTFTMTPPALATSATARPWRLQLDVRRESATEVHVSGIVTVNSVAAAVASGISTTSHASAVTVDMKAQVAAGGSQEITLASVSARYFPA